VADIQLSTAEHTELAGCSCPSCMTVIDPNDASLDPQAGGTANNKPIWTAEQAAAYLNRTSGQWGNGTNDQSTKSGDQTVITFGFHEDQASLERNGYVYEQGGTLYGLSEYFQFGAFSEAQRAATREAMDYWDDVIAVSFRETSADAGDINFGNLTNSPNTQAYSRIPTTGLQNLLGGQVAGIAGDVWVSTAQRSNFQFDEGLYGLNTLTHEVGHSLGLSHPGAYNFGPGFAVTYANGAEYAQDARNYSIMSYWNPRDLGTAGGDIATRDFDWSLMGIAYGATPMVHDILAAQKMYGAEMTTRTGDTTYGFNSNAGRDAFDFNKTAWPTMAIWDAGGNDTLDASGFNVTQRIDLTPGSLSSIGGVTYAEALETLTYEVVNANRKAANYAEIDPVTGAPTAGTGVYILRATYNANMAALAAQPDFRGRLTDNVGIAYGATIENAVGGSGSDTILGNAANNTLQGNAGNDVIEGRAGDDTLRGGAGDDQLDGGEGVDTADFADGPQGVTASLVAGTATGAGTDTLTSIENLRGSRGDDTLTGNAGANRLKGETGNDRIDGGAGNDQLFGDAGDDTLIGGLGDDQMDGGAGVDTADFNATRNAVTVDLSNVRAQNTGAGLDRLAGFENLRGSNFGDTLTGDAGANRFKGEAGNDMISGLGGDDTLLGDGGDDVLNGGTGYDVLTGGAGVDTFVFDSLGGDFVSDWRSGEKIDVTALGASGVNIVTRSGRATVSFDLDGDGQFDDGFFTVNVGNQGFSADDLVLL
jgi:serralysin